MTVSASFFADEKTTLSSYDPTNGSALTLSANKFVYDHITIFGLPEPIVKAFLDYYGDPNAKTEVVAPELEQV